MTGRRRGESGVAPPTPHAADHVVPTRGLSEGAVR